MFQALVELLMPVSVVLLLLGFLFWKPEKPK